MALTAWLLEVSSTKWNEAKLAANSIKYRVQATVAAL
jgi:hypothetical protein